LWTAFWPEGTVLFEPGGPSYIGSDGTLAMKFPWWRGEGVVGKLEIKGRRLDDDGNCLLRFNNGARGILHASQISIGEENNLAIWIYGEDKSLEWRQEHLDMPFPATRASACQEFLRHD